MSKVIDEPGFRHYSCTGITARYSASVGVLAVAFDVVVQSVCRIRVVVTHTAGRSISAGIGDDAHLRHIVDPEGALVVGMPLGLRRRRLAERAAEAVDVSGSRDTGGPGAIWVDVLVVETYEEVVPLVCGGIVISGGIVGPVLACVVDSVKVELEGESAIGCWIALARHRTQLG